MRTRRTISLGVLGVLSLSLAVSGGTVRPAHAASQRARAQSTSRLVSTPEVRGRGNTNIQSSDNWSGYAITGGSFDSVSATWTVPTAKSKVGTRYSAQWIGIDGDGNTDLIQTGTQVESVGTSYSYGVWWEILPKPETPIDEPVLPGQTITASIVEQSAGLWTITISNGTWTDSVTRSYSGPGTSVEWIDEAPEVDGAIAHMENTTPVTFHRIQEDAANPVLTAANEIECNQYGRVVEVPSATTVSSKGLVSFALKYGAIPPPPPKY